MRPSLVSAGAVAILALAMPVSIVAPTRAVRAERATSPEATKLISRLPVAFVPNLGQWDHAARYVARIGAMNVFLEQSGWTFTLAEESRGVAVRMTCGGAAELVAEERLPGRHNYFLGSDPARWRSDVPLYRAVRYREVQRGVDVRAREQDGHFEYDLLLQPGADLEPVEIAVAGIERMHVDGDALVLETCLGPVRMPAPTSWEEGPAGERSAIACRYDLRGSNRFGFAVDGRQHNWALVVDPGLVWSKFFGGTKVEHALAIALDERGAPTVVGNTFSADFPTTPGAFDTTYNSYAAFPPDVFVTQLSPTGSSLVYSTFLGGTHQDDGLAVALDAQGGAIVTGWTASPNFPTTPGALDTSFNGFRDGFVTRLSPTGSSLVYSTYLGGTYEDWINAVAVDAQGAATVAGASHSFDFPTTPGAFDTSFNNGSADSDAVVVRLSPTGSSLVYATYLGGSLSDQAYALALDASGAATVAGSTNSSNFPTTPGAFDTSYNGGSTDAFVARLSPTGSGLVYSTFLGGAGGETPTALALDAQGTTTVAGWTFSTNFPVTAGAFDPSYNGNWDAFVTRLSSVGSSLIYSTHLGGMESDLARGLSVDPEGAATVVGETASVDFPTTLGAWSSAYNGGGTDGFVARLSPTGSRLVYASFLGGTGPDQALAVALDAQGAATIAGGNGGDAFVMRLDMLPMGVAAFGRSSGGCTGPLAISVSSMPRVGNAGFALTCGNAPPSASGACALTGSRLANAIPVLGVEVWVDPSSAFVSVSASSNQAGASDVPMPIPNIPALAGGRLFAQLFWIGPSAPPPCPPLGLSASHALEITIQP